MSTTPPIRAAIRRWYVPNAVYFVTAVTEGRRRIFADEANVLLLRETMRLAQVYHPFKMRAYAFMPEHLHLLMFVPETTDISKLMQSIQQNMTINYKKARGVARSLRLWQRGFWDHVIRDEADFERHFDYIHYNPVKHGLVTHPRDYPHTSYALYARRGWYDPGWGQDGTPATLREPGFEPGE